MPSDLHQRLAKKKGGVMVTLQNTTEMTIAVLTGSLTKGKVEKASPMPTLIQPVSQSDVGFYAPEGQWSFGVQGNSAYKTRLTLLHSAEHANLERLPGDCPWSADLQQLWKADVPHIIITFLLREGSSASDSTTPSKAPAGSGKYVIPPFHFFCGLFFGPAFSASLPRFSHTQYPRRMKKVVN